MGTRKRIDIRYFAGIVDGEGCISISYDKLNSRRSPRFVCQLSVSNTNIQLLKDLKKQFRGSVHNLRQLKGYKLCGNWTVTAKAAEKVARKLLPHLRVKHKQAKLLIKLSSRKDINNRRRLSEKEINIRMGLWKRCGELNGYNQKKRGPGKHSITASLRRLNKRKNL